MRPCLLRDQISSAVTLRRIVRLAGWLWVGSLLIAPLSALALSGCGRSAATAGAARAGRLEVVAAENFWGSIARQLAGDRAHVTSIVVNPGTDPHGYEPTAQDARTLAGAQLAIVNGSGYDSWASRLLGASPQADRKVLDVGALLGLRDGANPHQWYSPRSVRRVSAAIVAAYDRLDPAGAAYFAGRRRAFEKRDLARYDALRGEIRRRYAGVAVGYSESVFQPLGKDLGLDLLTPYSFARAVAEGTDITAEDKQAVEAQVRDHRIDVWIFNRQNVTPDVQRVNEIARADGIPVVAVTETLSPASDSFQQWQVGQLRALARALAHATGR
jgi:zinc/manganese transport system substrate-binding protein